ncbi:hypothetical protein CDEF62S_01576 [Castellaniella defragrans]
MGFVGQQGQRTGWDSVALLRARCMAAPDAVVRPAGADPPAALRWCRRLDFVASPFSARRISAGRCSSWAWACAMVSASRISSRMRSLRACSAVWWRATVRWPSKPGSRQESSRPSPHSRCRTAVSRVPYGRRRMDQLRFVPLASSRSNQTRRGHGRTPGPRARPRRDRAETASGSSGFQRRLPPAGRRTVDWMNNRSPVAMPRVHGRLPAVIAP